MVRNSRGNYTDKNILRCARISGPFGRTLYKLFTQAGLVDMAALDARKASPQYSRDIQRFIQDYQEFALYDYLPGRQHDSFPEFVHSTAITAPWKLEKKLRKLCHRMDQWRHNNLRRRQNEQWSRIHNYHLGTTAQA